MGGAGCNTSAHAYCSRPDDVDSIDYQAMNTVALYEEHDIVCACTLQEGNCIHHITA